MVYLLSSCIFAFTLLVPDQYPQIMDAVYAAQTGDTVLVSPGIYHEDIDFIGKDIVLKSASGSDVTTIQSVTNGAVVVFENGETTGAVLEGFTVTGGEYCTGQGIQISEASPSILNNHICWNNYHIYSSGMGAGISCFGSSGIIRGNRIEGNTLRIVYGYGPIMGSGAAFSGGAPVFENNLLIDNLCSMDDATFVEGIAIYASNTESLEIRNCLIAGTYWENYPPLGTQAAIYLDNAVNTVLDNVTIADNQAIAVHLKNQSDLSIQSCILRDSLFGYEVKLENGSALIMGYSCILGGESSIHCDSSSSVFWGSGNTDSDPVFIQGSICEYHLTEGVSTCIDAGCPDPVCNDPQDPENPGYALWPALGTVTCDMGLFGGQGAVFWNLEASGLGGHSQPTGNPGFLTVEPAVNPAADSGIFISFTGTGEVGLTVHDITGRLVYEASLKPENCRGRISLPMEETGVYICSVRAGDETATERVTITR